jgi:hypothetical protein
LRAAGEGWLPCGERLGDGDAQQERSDSAAPISVLSLFDHLNLFEHFQRHPQVFSNTSGGSVPEKKKYR